MTRSSLAFSPEDSGPLFTAESKHLLKTGLTLARLKQIWRSAFLHFNRIFQICPRFCEKFHKTDDMIDISKKDTSFWPFTMKKIEWSIALQREPFKGFHRDLDRMIRNTKKQKKKVIAAWNAFINAMIQAQGEVSLDKRRVA